MDDPSIDTDNTVDTSISDPSYYYTDNSSDDNTNDNNTGPDYSVYGSDQGP